MEKIAKQTERKIKKLFETYGVEEDLLDWKSEYDFKVNEFENLSHISELIETLSSSKDSVEKSNADLEVKKKSIKNEKNEVDRVNFENNKKEVEISQKEFKKSLEKLNENNSVLEKLYYLPKEYVKVIANPNNEIYGGLFLGTAGTGKSYGVIQVLNEIKANYVYFSGFTTPLALYKFLYDNREAGKTIVLDDTFGILNNNQSIMILLNALYSSSGKRKIMWNSTKLKDIPTEFIFDANLIVILNEIPKNMGTDLVNSRCLTYRFEFNNFEILAIMKAISQLPHSKLKKEEREEVVSYIENYIDETTQNFDLRVQNKIENLYLYSKDKWKELSLPLLKSKNEKMVLLKKFLTECATLQEAKKRFNEEGLGGERTFQRYNKQLKEATIRQGF